MFLSLFSFSFSFSFFFEKEKKKEKDKDEIEDLYLLLDWNLENLGLLRYDQDIL